jgi:hypothetical protein
LEIVKASSGFRWLQVVDSHPFFSTILAILLEYGTGVHRWEGRFPLSAVVALLFKFKQSHRNLLWVN